MTSLTVVNNYGITLRRLSLWWLREIRNARKEKQRKKMKRLKSHFFYISTIFGMIFSVRILFSHLCDFSNDSNAHVTIYTSYNYSNFHPKSATTCIHTIDENFFCSPFLSLFSKCEKNKEGKMLLAMSRGQWRQENYHPFISHNPHLLPWRLLEEKKKRANILSIYFIVGMSLARTKREFS